MGRNNYFQFKQFKIIQNDSAMKVGTDGVLLGAWVNTGSASTILDVGTGTGLIAIMMAQRTDASITGIEIEEKASSEAVYNATNCPWSHRIQIINISLQEFYKKAGTRYDLIVSNPPFFTNSKKSKHENLAIARHNHLLPFSELINACSDMLAEAGRIALIVPVEAYNEIKFLARKSHLHIIRETSVKPCASKKPHRMLLELGKTTTISFQKETILIHNDMKNDYSKEFIKLISPFYLHY